MPDLAAFAAELRRLAKPHALVRRADVRREALLDLARRIERAGVDIKVNAPAPPITVTGSASVPVERRRGRRTKRLSTLEELQVLFASEAKNDA